jgi:hypothetical protein
MERNTAKQKRDASDTLPVEMWAEVVGWLHRDCTRQTHPRGHGGAHARGDDGAADRNFLLRSVALVSPLWRYAFHFLFSFFWPFYYKPRKYFIYLQYIEMNRIFF